MIVNVPAQLKANISNVFGERGRQWLAALPQQVANFAHRWELGKLKALENLTYHYVLIAHKKDYAKPVVLKLGVATAELNQEINALTAYQGRGTPLLLASDAAQGALLMECVAPGTTLKGYFPQHETATLTKLANVITRLHQTTVAPDGSFPTLEQWHHSLRIAKPSEVISATLLEKAQLLSKQLIASQTERVLLHADLHHDNLLCGPEDVWFAIDPKGVIGEPAYEVGAFLRNPIPQLLQQPDVSAIVRQRISALSSMLKLDKERVTHWSFVQAVLAACWSLEENQLVHADYFVRYAKLIERL